MRRTLAAALSALASVLGACSAPPPKARPVQPVLRDVPSILRGTIGAETTLRGLDPMLVSGFGLVVGLNGTGGGDLPERISSTMERELGLRGVGRTSETFRGTPLEGLSPREVLRHPDVAVVVVYAVVPPAAPGGATFDVYVQAVSTSSMVSLDGGSLWTTDLQVGIPQLLGGYRTRQVGVARGPLFINPFAEPGAQEVMTGRIGRVLAGGVVTKPQDLELILDNESHGRASAIKTAVNNRFPEAARGRTGRLVTLEVPAAYRDRSEEFINIVRYTVIDQSFPDEYARRYAEGLKAQPWLADELSWCLQALGPRPALPFVRDLYEFPELAPRMAALRVGARLNDPIAARHLQELALAGPPMTRKEAIQLLGAIDGRPDIDQTLVQLLSEEELDLRIAAYEALARRAEQVQQRRLALMDPQRPAASRVSDPVYDYAARARAELPPGMLQGVSRRGVGYRDGAAGPKFYLDVVRSGSPLVYVTQQGQPRIVVFGENVEVRRPVIVSAWSDRLMLAADGPTDDLRLYYRPPDRHGRPSRPSTMRVRHKVNELVEFLAREPSTRDPSPGLGLSYSEVVGALYAIQRSGGMDAAFATENDRLLAAILKAVHEPTVAERPETVKDDGSATIFEPVSPEAIQGAPRRPDAPLVEPIERGQSAQK